MCLVFIFFFGALQYFLKSSLCLSAFAAIPYLFAFPLFLCVKCIFVFLSVLSALLVNPNRGIEFKTYFLLTKRSVKNISII
jgi:hypothetical protein